MLINRRIIVCLILTLLIGKNLGTSKGRHKKVDSLLAGEEERKILSRQKQLASSFLQEEQLAPTLLPQKKQLAPSLLQIEELKQERQEKLAPSLLQKGEKASSLLQHGKLVPSLLQERQKPPSLLRKGEKAPSLLQHGKLAPSLLEKGENAPSLLENGEKAPSLLQKGEKAQSLVQHEKKAQNLVQPGKLAPSLLSPTEPSAASDVNRFSIGAGRFAQIVMGKEYFVDNWEKAKVVVADRIFYKMKRWSESSKKEKALGFGSQSYIDVVTDGQGNLYAYKRKSTKREVDSLLACKARCPNVVQILVGGETTKKGKYHFVMELASAKLSEMEIWTNEICSQIEAGLQQLHAADWVHLDLGLFGIHKTDHMMLFPDPKNKHILVAKLIDLGLARRKVEKLMLWDRKHLKGTLRSKGCISFPINKKQMDAIEENGHIWRVKDMNGLRVLTDDRHDGATYSAVEIDNNGINRQNLEMKYHKAMVIQLLGNTTKTNKVKILNIGLGGGELANFLGELDPTMDITSVEISPAIIRIATKYFDYKERNNQRAINKDGIEYIQQAATEGKKFNWIIIDACDATGQNAPLICPVYGFMNRDIAQMIHQLIPEKGVLVINTHAAENSSEVKERRMALKQAYGSHFNDCYFVDSTTNIILTCLKGSSSGKKMNKKDYKEMVKGIRPIAGSWAKQLLKTVKTVFVKEL